MSPNIGYFPFPTRLGANARQLLYSLTRANPSHPKVPFRRRGTAIAFGDHCVNIFFAPMRGTFSIMELESS